MREMKTFITSFFYYSKLKKYFPDYKIGRIKYAITVVRWNKSSEVSSTSEELPKWKCMYMNEPIPKERRQPDEPKTD